MHRHTADPREQKGQTAARPKGRPDRPHARRRQEMPKECRRATWPERDIRESTIAAPLGHLARAERRATKREGRPQEKLLARTDAMLPIATRSEERRVGKECRSRWS